MRFSCAIPSIFLLLLLALMNIVAAEPIIELLTSEGIEAQIINHYLSKRAHGDAAAATNGTTTASIKTNVKSTLASPAILQGGTLFYIGTAVTCLLWSTGRFIDFKMERQERYAESLVHSI